MQIIDNRNKIFKDELVKNIKKNSKISIAASCFSIYAFNELKVELEKIEELRFIFTSPTFIEEKQDKQKREFYIPRLNREKSLYGTEFEIKLKNELNQKSIAKECADWIRKKVIFKSNKTDKSVPQFLELDKKITYTGFKGFTESTLGTKESNDMFTIINEMETNNTKIYLEEFDMLWENERFIQDVTEEVIENITTAYVENSPEFMYFLVLYNIFSEFLENLSEDYLPNEDTGFKNSYIWNKLYDFQKQAVIGIISKLEKYNGCILADSVGLGKTYTSLAVMKYYQSRNKNVLVLCPKKLSENWNIYKANYKNNPIKEDRLGYDVLYHTDLNRKEGESNGVNLSYIDWGNYDLVVIDESHNFRNGGRARVKEDNKQNRYDKLLNNVMKKGVKTKVLMLTATPVNNRFKDLQNQLELAYEGNTEEIDSKLNLSKSINDIFRLAQKEFNEWSKLEPDYRTTENLLNRLDFEFFELLDNVTIARSRKHIEKYFNDSAIGKFPKRLKPISKSPELIDINGGIGYNEIFQKLSELELSVYTPTKYILESKKGIYQEKYDDRNISIGFTQENREKGIRRLTSINLMKRLESSGHSFVLTIDRIRNLINKNISEISSFEKRRSVKKLSVDYLSRIEEDISEEFSEDTFIVGKKVEIDISDMDYITWKKSLIRDEEILGELLLEMSIITKNTVYDNKLQELLRIIDKKMKSPINDNNKKILIFTAYADTAEYLYNQVSKYVTKKYNRHTALITGSIDGRNTISNLKSDMNNILAYFSPISKEKHLIDSEDKREIDILIATDCISEGQNLQDCDYMVNYDIHWNPVRIIQRFGRIDRIGSRNDKIQLVNFWPNVTLDEYINLKTKIETRIKILDMSGAGNSNIIEDEDEKMELEYRKNQLSRLKEEVVDLEDMSDSVSIMDLGLNEYRMDLLEYMKKNPNIEKMPLGLHGIIKGDENNPPGVIYVLKNTSKNVNRYSKNRIHPFYMIYIGNDGEIIVDHLSPKEVLERLQTLCKGKDKPIKEAYEVFNRETKEGKNMSKFSELLEDTITSIVFKKEENDIDEFLSGRKKSFLKDIIQGIEDFQLICFLIVK